VFRAAYALKVPVCRADEVAAAKEELAKRDPEGLPELPNPAQEASDRRKLSFAAGSTRAVVAAMGRPLGMTGEARMAVVAMAAAISVVGVVGVVGVVPLAPPRALVAVVAVRLAACTVVAPLDVVPLVALRSVVIVMAVVAERSLVRDRMRRSSAPLRAGVSAALWGRSDN
jgi:hypothetical protein